MDDREIIKLFNSRDEDAISQTRFKYGRVILHTALDITQSSEDAEECENDTYVRLWNTIPPEEPRSLKAYALTIVRHLAVDILRLRKRRNHAFEELAVCVSGIVTEFDGNLLTEIINDFLKSLDDDNRKIFVARYFYSSEISSIAKAMGLSRSSVDMRLARMRNRLASELREKTDYLKNDGEKQ